MKVSVYNQSAEVVGDIELNSKIFGAKPNIHLLSEAVRIQQSNARKGLAHTKTRGEVRGGGKKPWKQKGTGRARAGSIRGPIWRHGGIALGPRSERNWSLKLNKKAKTQALFMSLSDKVASGKLIVIDKVTLTAAKTKEFAKFITVFKGKIQDLGKQQMFLVPKNDQALVRASRNLPAITATFAASLNVQDVLKADSILILKDSLEVIEKTYLREVKPKTAAKVAKKATAKPATKTVKE
jgi:large subunit ribosomal protein L4